MEIGCENVRKDVKTRKSSGKSVYKMALIGSIEPLTASSDYETYMERMDYLFECNVVEQNKKVALFCTLIGGEAYQTLKDLLAPEVPGSKTYDELKNVLKGCMAPKKLIIAESFKFYQANQGEKSVSEYIVNLKSLAKYCEFGTFLDRALRDKFVCGLTDHSIQRKLLAEGNLSFNDACRIALAVEAVQVQCKELGAQSVNKISGKVNSSWKASGKKDSKDSRCKRCGRSHGADCPAKNWKCYNCNKTGHISKYCFNKRKVHAVNTQSEDIESEESATEEEVVGKIEFDVHSIYKSLCLELIIENKKLNFEVDTGSAVSILSKQLFERYLNKIKLDVNDTKLVTVAGNKLDLVGLAMVKVQFNKQCKTLPLYIVNNNRDILLLGRNWLDILIPKWKNVFKNTAIISKVDACNKNVNQFSENLEKNFSMVFNKDHSQVISKFKVNLCVKEDSTPVFHRPYQIPYAVRADVEKELNELERTGVVERVSYSEWGSPIVTVKKKNGGIRICGDFKVTLNPCLKVDQYPLPLVEEVIYKVSKGRYFSILDLSKAYLQCALTEESQKLVTVNTHKGLYRYKRLPFGVASAPALFQRIMEQILLDLPQCACYLDDIIICGKDQKECERNVIVVLERLKKYNVKVNLEKCMFNKTEVEFLGFRLSKEGIKPSSSKIKAIQEAPTPTNLTQLRSYLGLLNYYNKFIPMSSELLKPLYNLERKDVQFQWTNDCKEAFEKSKSILVQSSLLVHYNPDEEIVISSDASPYACGAVLSHVINGNERPIMFVSSTFTDAEKNYAQIEREALAIIFALKRFHKFIYGRAFTIYTDHKPLEYILGEKKKIPVQAASRVQRWAIILSTYRYTIKYRPGKYLGNADALSRLPLPESTEVNAVIEMNTSPLTADIVASNTVRDQTLCKVIDYTRRGWPMGNIKDVNLKYYYTRRNELSTEGGCLLWINRVVIPYQLRTVVLQMLHEGHIGIVRMKILTRSYYWWPGIDADIENFVNSCEICNIYQPKTKEITFTMWTKSHKVWSRLHIDFLQIFQKYFLIIIDSYSRWMDVYETKSTNSQETIDKLRTSFAIFGLPDEIVSDNGPPFNGEIYRKFCAANGIKCTLTPPLHPRSNGTVEKQVNTFKKGILKQMKDVREGKLDLNHYVQNFLLKYRITPNSVTGISPAELMFRRIPKTKLDLLRPTANCKREGREIENEKRREEDQNTNRNRYIEGQSIWIFNKRNGTNKWMNGKIAKIVSPYTYLVYADGEVRYVHADDIRANTSVTTSTPVTSLPTIAIETNPDKEKDNIKTTEATQPETAIERNNTTNEEIAIPNSEVPQVRRSNRRIKPPDRLNL